MIAVWQVSKQSGCEESAIASGMGVIASDVEKIAVGIVRPRVNGQAQQTSAGQRFDVNKNWSAAAALSYYSSPDSSSDLPPFQRLTALAQA